MREHGDLKEARDFCLGVLAAAGLFLGVLLVSLALS